MSTLGLRYRNRYRVEAPEGEGAYARLVLTDAQGRPRAETLISLCDLEAVLSEGRWHTRRQRKHVRHTEEFYLYAVNQHRRDGRDRCVSLHRFILDAPASAEVDHINHDTLDNRRENLRLVTKSQNQQNIGGAHRDSKSGARNVYWQELRQRWVVQICVDGKRHFFGAFATVEEAEPVATAARIALQSHCPENSPLAPPVPAAWLHGPGTDPFDCEVVIWERAE